ncbi:hypothetical protein ACP4OV_031013 [Aristida adscensionis]
MDKQKKLSFSLPSKPGRPRPLPRPAAAADEDAPASRSAPARHFVTEFDPTQTLPPATPPALAIAPLPNSARFLTRRPRTKPSSHPASGAGGRAFVPNDTSAAISYGLTLRGAAAERESGRTPPPPPPPPSRRASGGDLMLLRFREDVAALPEHRGADEFRGVTAEGFAAALLAGYGWSEGKGIGRNNREGDDVRVFEHRRRTGTWCLGYSPSAAGPRKTRSGDWVIGDEKVTHKRNGNAKKRCREGSGDRTEEESDSGARKRCCEQYR